MNYEKKGGSKNFLTLVFQAFIISTLFSGVGFSFSQSASSFWKYPNVLLVFLVIVYSFAVLWTGKMRLNRIHLLVFLLLAIIAAGALVAIDALSFYNHLFAILRGTILVTIAPYFVRKLSDVVNAVNAMIFTGILGAISALFQEFWYLTAKVPIFGVSGDYDLITVAGTVFLRVSSFIADPNVFAIFLVVPIGFLLAKYQSKKISSLSFYGLFLLLISALVFTFSRGAFVGLSLFLAYIFLREPWYKRIWLGYASKKKLYLTVIFSGFSIVCGTIFYLRESAGDISTSMRALLLRESVQITLQHPIIGVGVGNIENYTDAGQTAHDLFIEISASAGLLALAVFVLIIGILFKQIKAINRRSAEIGEMLKNGVIIFIFSSLFLSTFTNILLWLLIGLINAAYLARLTQKNEPSPQN